MDAFISKLVLVVLVLSAIFVVTSTLVLWIAVIVDAFEYIFKP